MYLHLGQNVVVPVETVIGIFDLDNTTSSHITRKFLGDAEKAGYVYSVSDELPNSFVVCSDICQKPSGQSTSGENYYRSNEMKIYLSQLSSQTLLKRSETMRFEVTI